MAIVVAGLNHRTAPIALREQLAVEEDKLRELIRDVQAAGVTTEAVLLSTCNRVEMYAVAEAPGEARAAVFRRLCQHRGVDPATVEPFLYTHVDEDAIRHVFRVASSLDSMMVGEPQILGQVKDAFALAQACETVGPTLHTMFSQAFAVAKKVRTETDIARHAVSVSFAAVELAKKIFAGLTGRAVLLVGAGKMSELAARHLVDQGAFPIYVANRTWSRAQELARALSGTAVPFAELGGTLASVDIVVTSTGAPEPVIRRELVQRVMHDRRGRPLFFIDIAVPRDVDASVGTLDDVYCYDIDDLKQVVDANLRERAREAQRAESLVDREVGKFTARLRDVEVVPTIVSLRERLESIRLAEVKRALGRIPDATPETREAMDALSNAIVNKILHAPVTKLRESGRAGAGRSWTALVQELFGLGAQLVIRIGTRSSVLALAQAASVASALRARGHETEIVPMRTEGDRLANARLATVGGKGLFVREIEEALLARTIDVAVHSLKDLPAELPDGLALVAFPAREDPRDVIVTRTPGGVAALPMGAVVGTSSPRRRALLLSARADLDVEPLRGNVDTRLRKLDAGECAAILLAAAGLRRLGLTPANEEPLPIETFVPAVGQGVLGLEARVDDEHVGTALAALDDPGTRACAVAERAFLARLGASCVTPVAAHAVLEGDALRMQGLVVTEDGRRILREHGTAVSGEALTLGQRLADGLLKQGAADLVALAPRR